MEESNHSSRIQRNLKERDRRTHLKNLIGSLASVLCPRSKLSAPGLLEEAASHIKQMHARIKELKIRKAQAQEDENSCKYQLAAGNSRVLPILDVKSNYYTVEVNIISGVSKNFMLHEVITVMHEEGAEVVSFSCNKAADRFIYTIKSQAICSRIGIETRKINERLKDLVQ